MQKKKVLEAMGFCKAHFFIKWDCQRAVASAYKQGMRLRLIDGFYLLEHFFAIPLLLAGRGCG